MKKIILFHNFKCGGTTIRNALKDEFVFDILPRTINFDIDSVANHNVTHVHQGNGKNVRIVSSLISRFGLEQVKNDFLFITTIRNPIKLLESFYRWGVYRNHELWFGIFPPYVKSETRNDGTIIGISHNYNEEISSSEQEKTFNDIVGEYINYYSRNKVSCQTIRRKNSTSQPSLYFNDPNQKSNLVETFDHLFLQRERFLVEDNEEITVSYAGQQCNRFIESLGVTPLYLASKFPDCVFVDTEIQDIIMMKFLEKHEEFRRYFKNSYLQSLVDKGTDHIANQNTFANNIKLDLTNQIKYYSQFPDDFTFWESSMRHMFTKLLL